MFLAGRWLAESMAADDGYLEEQKREDQVLYLLVAKRFGLCCLDAHADCASEPMCLEK